MNWIQLKAMLLHVCAQEIAHKDTLCRLDSFIGDGDHGFTVERGFRAVQEALQDASFQTPAEVLLTAGNTLSDSMGGAIGLIMGALFSGGGDAVRGADILDATAFGKILSEGMEQIQQIGGAKVGDKTMLDALAPASAAFDQAAASGADLKTCLAAAAQAGRAGSDATRDLAARKGRAKFLQEKSRGYVDAGSVTMAIALEAMAEYAGSAL